LSKVGVALHFFQQFYGADRAKATDTGVVPEAQRKIRIHQAHDANARFSSDAHRVICCT